MISNWVQHNHDGLTPDLYPHQRPPAPLWIVVPHVRQSLDAHDRIQNVVRVQMVMDDSFVRVAWLMISLATHRGSGTPRLYGAPQASGCRF